MPCPQLRLHCAHHGHPIIGDATYSTHATDRLAYRTFLHAAALTLCERLHEHAAPMMAALTPAGWTHAFEPREPWRSPARWPAAAETLLTS